MICSSSYRQAAVCAAITASTIHYICTCVSCCGILRLYCITYQTKWTYFKILHVRVRNSWYFFFLLLLLIVVVAFDFADDSSKPITNNMNLFMEQLTVVVAIYCVLLRPVTFVLWRWRRKEKIAVLCRGVQCTHIIQIPNEPRRK